jgi:4-oxalocrotonate tautomerase
MPMINVQMFEGRTLGCTPDAVQIILTDIKKENWAEAGKLSSDT